MKTVELDYDLANELIAQEPAEPRDSSRLLVLNRKSSLIEHKRFFEIGKYLKPGDILIVNDTKVLPARLIGRKQDTGAKIEILLLAETNVTSSDSSPLALNSQKNRWEVLARPAKRLKTGTIIEFAQNIKAEVVEQLEDGRRLLEFFGQKAIRDTLRKIGKIPLPPYIEKPLVNPQRYQTIYAKKEESAAAPTAGLHFTPDLIERLKNKGVRFANVSLRIGLDTFQPIREKEVERHKIHTEHFEINQETAELIDKARMAKQRIIAVGTTSARVLETLETLRYPPAGRRGAQDDKQLKKVSGYTDLFIYPGYEFKAVGAMITNFHLPKSTLLAMISAFAGINKTKKAYKEAIKNRYRFFSFGDAMLIV